MGFPCSNFLEPYLLSLGMAAASGAFKPYPGPDLWWGGCSFCTGLVLGGSGSLKRAHSNTSQCHFILKGLKLDLLFNAVSLQCISEINSPKYMSIHKQRKPMVCTQGQGCKALSAPTIPPMAAGLYCTNLHLQKCPNGKAFLEGFHDNNEKARLSPKQ